MTETQGSPGQPAGTVTTGSSPSDGVGTRTPEPIRIPPVGGYHRWWGLTSATAASPSCIRGTVFRATFRPAEVL